MTDSGKCEHSVTPGWSETSGESTFACEKGSLSFKNAIYTRSDATKESSVVLKLSFAGCNKLTVLKLVANARFVEVSVMKDSLLKYLATVRGTAPEPDSSFQSDFPLFEGQYSDDTCEFRELHLKFLSIKPAPGQGATQPVQLVLKSLLCEYTAGTPDTAPPLQQGPGMGMGGIGGMGGGGGAEMMAMMAMSMMGGGMGGGMGGRGGMPMPANSTGGLQGAPRNRPLEAPPANAEKPTSSGSTVANTAHSVPAAGTTINDTAGNATAAHTNRNTTASSTADTGATQRAEPKTTHAPTHTAPPAPPSRPAPNKPAPAPAGLDGAQLASIMWTVKSSMIDEISQLLDRKLAPVMARLDGIDAKLRTLETEVRTRQEVETVVTSVPVVGDVNVVAETCECDA